MDPLETRDLAEWNFTDQDLLSRFQVGSMKSESAQVVVVHSSDKKHQEIGGDLPWVRRERGREHFLRPMPGTSQYFMPNAPEYTETQVDFQFQPRIGPPVKRTSHTLPPSLLNNVNIAQSSLKSLMKKRDEKDIVAVADEWCAILEKELLYSDVVLDDMVDAEMEKLERRGMVEDVADWGLLQGMSQELREHLSKSSGSF
ncbi:hypothetical protein Ciccas_004200 [Cichlidogyrus casuarinus]|uniref:Uncharacterized protein n=1 Tax=Cichlidogyrus casuarinus TaxID=1844966 RepID=A0ABD2QC72_9PLAT